MKFSATTTTFVLLALVAFEALTVANAQLFETLFGNRGDSLRVRGQREPGVSNTNGEVNVNVPGFYDMFKSGSSLGINVLSGLVRVDRGQEAERNGLVSTGYRNPLSVRVFGIPVYERGVRVRDPDRGPFGGDRTPSNSGPEDEPKVEDIPASRTNEIDP